MSFPANSPGFRRVRWFFLRALGAVYAAAFASLLPQILGLVGSAGILPAAELVAEARAALGPAGFLQFPTLFWFGVSDAALAGACLLGVAAATLVIADFFPRAALAAAWALYLSLFTVARDFMGFQWDVLLLETGFLAIFLAPSKRFPRDAEKPAPREFVWLFRWLVFRLMFSSGFVKLMSGDPAWRSLEALSYHYETQPLPPWAAWHAHHLPASLHAASALVMFAIELVLPFFVFGPRPLRRTAFGGFALLQLLIIATGNYGFFNLLTLALCLTLLDDKDLPGSEAPVRLAEGHRRAWLVMPLAAFLALTSAWQLFTRECAVRPLAPFCLANNYGLFAVMTTERPEIVIEGTLDGVNWTEYPFRHKPGDPSRRPGFVQPHMPRMDWLLWFAALGDFPRNPWVGRLCIRLMERSPAVLSLFAYDPFRGNAPLAVRAVRYDYRFTTPEERGRTGDWWARSSRRRYSPDFS